MGGGLLSGGVQCGDPACGFLSTSGLGRFATLPSGEDCEPGQGGWRWVVWGLVGERVLTSGQTRGLPAEGVVNNSPF